jgi:Cft2 family RNA processing exonuclease
MSFSAHADAKGIMQLISWCEPKNVMLVHGEAAKMDFLKNKIQTEFGTSFRPMLKNVHFVMSLTFIDMQNCRDNKLCIGLQVVV